MEHIYKMNVFNYYRVYLIGSKLDSTGRYLADHYMETIVDLIESGFSTFHYGFWKSEAWWIIYSANEPIPLIAEDHGHNAVWSLFLKLWFTHISQDIYIWKEKTNIQSRARPSTSKGQRHKLRSERKLCEWETMNKTDASTTKYKFSFPARERLLNFQVALQSSILVQVWCLSCVGLARWGSPERTFIFDKQLERVTVGDSTNRLLKCTEIPANGSFNFQA